MDLKVEQRRRPEQRRHATAQGAKDVLGPHDAPTPGFQDSRPHNFTVPAGLIRLACFKVVRVVSGYSRHTQQVVRGAVQSGGRASERPWKPWKGFLK